MKTKVVFFGVIGLLVLIAVVAVIWNSQGPRDGSASEQVEPIRNTEANSFNSVPTTDSLGPSAVEETVPSPVITAAEDPTVETTETSTMEEPQDDFWMVSDLTLDMWDGDRELTSPELFEQGVQLFNRGNDREAMDTLQRFLDVNPGNPETHLIFSYIYFEQGNYPDAIEEANDVVIEAPGFAAGWLQRARIREALREYEEAAVDLERYRELAPDETTRNGAERKIAELRKLIEDIENQ